MTTCTLYYLCIHQCNLLTYDKYGCVYSFVMSLHKQCHLHQQCIMLCFENMFEVLLRDKCLSVDGLGWVIKLHPRPFLVHRMITIHALRIQTNRRSNEHHDTSAMIRSDERIAR